jgi:hypothetical protein
MKDSLRIFLVFLGFLSSGRIVKAFSECECECEKEKNEQ